MTLNVAVVDSTHINRVEYFVDADPGLGNGTSVTTTPVLPATSVTGTASINVGHLALGSHTVSVRARNTLGNWSAVTTLPLVTTALFADGFESGSFSAWSSAVNGADPHHRRHRGGSPGRHLRHGGPDQRRHVRLRPGQHARRRDHVQRGGST